MAEPTDGAPVPNDSEGGSSDAQNASGGASTRMAAYRFWAGQNKMLATLFLAVLLLSLALFVLGVYSHSEQNSADIFTGLNAVPWLAALLTILAVLLFLPTHIQSSHKADTSCQASCWTGAIVLFLILDLMSMCFAAADAADEKLSSTDTRRVFAIVFAVLYGILSLLVLLTLLLYLGCVTILRERKEDSQRRPSTQPLAQYSAADQGDTAEGSATITQTPKPRSLELKADDTAPDPALERFAQTPPATGGATGGALASRSRPTSQVFDTGSPMSINAPV